MGSRAERFPLTVVFCCVDARSALITLWLAPRAEEPCIACTVHSWQATSPAAIFPIHLVMSYSMEAYFGHLLNHYSTPYTQVGDFRCFMNIFFVFGPSVRVHGLSRAASILTFQSGSIRTIRRSQSQVQILETCIFLFRFVILGCSMEIWRCSMIVFNNR